MRKIKVFYACTVSEKFLIEKAVELTHKSTIESYRLRINNPYSVIRELKEVITDVNEGRLKNTEYANTLLAETEFFMGVEEELEFKTISKKYFRDLIGKTKTDFNHILYAANLILSENDDYTQNLFNIIELELSRLNTPHQLIVPPELARLDRLIGYLFISLKSKGYSKVYLHRFVRAVFCARSLTNFFDGLTALKTLLTRSPEKFTVIVPIQMTNSEAVRFKLLSDEFRFVSLSQKQRFVGLTNANIGDFFDKHNNKMFIGTTIEAADYYSASNKARDILMGALDILHMGYSDDNIAPIRECGVIGSDDTQKSRPQRFDYQIDGYYNSNQKLYELFNKKINDFKSKNISSTSKSKLFSGLRYLRLGSEANELENKLLNYWIGIEYVFSVYDADSYTMGRLRQYFKKCHAVVYLKKIMLDFHKSIGEFGLTNEIPNYSDDLAYLHDENSYNILIGKINDYPLIAFRANVLKAYLTDDKKMKGIIEKHQKNVDWNLNRLYRVRNEIVHNAALKSNIENLIGHLRGYLVFILNAIIEFFNETAVDINFDRQLTIDDYFIMQEIKLENFWVEKVGLFSKLMKEQYPLEYLT